MSIQIHEIINQFTIEAHNDNLGSVDFDHTLNLLGKEIANGLFYLIYIDYERNNYKEYFGDFPSVYEEYSLDLLSPEALAAYNRDKEAYPELFI